MVSENQASTYLENYNEEKDSTNSIFDTFYNEGGSLAIVELTNLTSDRIENI